jgi:hypothetical protein
LIPQRGPLMNKINLIAVCGLFLLVGCASTPQPVYQPLPPVKIITETVELQIYQPPLPPEIKLDDVKWFVITESNMEEKIAEIKKFTGSEFVVFGVTTQGYENMAYNLQEIRRYMRQQKEIIMYYREATKPKGAQGWSAENAEQQARQLESAAAQPEPVPVPSQTEPSLLQKSTGLFGKLLPF